ncbi:MAG: hypothetical protein ACOCX0_03525, partial [Bacteroidota bacterium]
MVLFFGGNASLIIAVHAKQQLTPDEISRLQWLFNGAVLKENTIVEGYFAGPRREMITPWSTNAVEITQNMGIEGIVRMEEFFQVDGPEAEYDPMLQA